MDYEKAKKTFKLDPRTKIYLLVVVSMSLFVGEATAGGEDIYKILLTLIPIILLVLQKHIKGAVLFSVLYIIVYFSGYIFRYISTTSLLGVSILLVMGLVSGMGPCIVLGYYLVTSTKINEFVAAMEKWHISQNIIIPFAVMFRFFPTLKEEYLSIKDAMRMRGIRFGSNPVAMLEYRFVPLIISMVKIGNELSAAAMTRGLGNDIKRTNMCKIGFGIADIFFAAVATVLCILYIII